MLRETRSRVRVEKELGESFWTAKGDKARVSAELATLYYTVSGLGGKDEEG